MPTQPESPQETALQRARSEIESPNSGVPSSKAYRIVKLTALRASRTIHIRIVCVDISTLAAPENVVIARSGANGPPPPLGPKGKRSDQGQRPERVKQQQVALAHGFAFSMRLVFPGETGHQWNTSCPQRSFRPPEAGCSGAKKNRQASAAANESISAEPLPGGKSTAERTRPSALTAIWTVEGERTSGPLHSGSFGWARRGRPASSPWTST